MNNIEERMDTFKTEELIYNAKMSYGNMDKMLEYIEELGEQLVLKDTSLQSLTNALQDNVSAPKFEQILNVSSEYMSVYMNRFTTNEMREKLEKEGFSNLNAVLVDKQFAEEAIENGREVFAIKSENIILLNKVGEVSQYQEKGYLIAVTPFTYEAEFNNDLDFDLDEE